MRLFFQIYCQQMSVANQYQIVKSNLTGMIFYRHYRKPYLHNAMAEMIRLVNYR